MLGFIRRAFGNRGEKAAAKFLKKSGMRILARQHATRWGEIDLICMDGDTIVFVEVKTGRSGTPGERVDAKKRRNVTKAALAWLKKNGLLAHRCRFDVVAVVWEDESKEPVIIHEAHAFEAVDFGMH